MWVPVPREPHLRFGTPTLLSAMFVEKKERERERGEGRATEKSREEKEGWIVGRSMKRERVKITNGWIKATRKVVW